jgi:hypothetical protein
MSNFNLNPIAAACGAQAAVFSDAASAEHQARDRWVKAAKVSVKAGVKLAMLVKGTEKAPNPQYDAQVVEVIRAAIVAGVSASKKSMKFSSPLPGSTGADMVSGKMHAWTVADLLALTRDQLRDIEDDVLKTQRRTFMQLVDGPMMSRLRGHIDKIENPDKARGTKGEKTADKAAAPNDGPLLDRMAALLQEFNASVLALKDANGKTLAGVIQAQEAGLELLARIGQLK